MIATYLGGNFSTFTDVQYSNSSWEFKDTHGKKAPSNKTLALTKSMNMDIWVVGKSNQLFIIGF